MKIENQKSEVGNSISKIETQNAPVGAGLVSAQNKNNNQNVTRRGTARHAQNRNYPRSPNYYYHHLNYLSRRNHKHNPRRKRNIPKKQRSSRYIQGCSTKRARTIR